MNFLKLLKDVGIIDNDYNFFNLSTFDKDNNCQKYSEVLFEAIDKIHIDNNIKNALTDFLFELMDLYKEFGFNLGCLFIERNHKKEFSLNDDTNKLEMKKILNFNEFMDVIFNRIWDNLIKSDIEENLFSQLQNKIEIMKRELILAGVPEEVNIVLNSTELKALGHFLIKTGFKCGVFICFSYKIMHMQIAVEPGNYLPGD